ESADSERGGSHEAAREYDPSRISGYEQFVEQLPNPSHPFGPYLLWDPPPSLKQLKLSQVGVDIPNFHGHVPNFHGLGWWIALPGAMGFGIQRDCAPPPFPALLPTRDGRPGGESRG